MWDIGKAFRHPPAVRPRDLYGSLSALLGISRPSDLEVPSLEAGSDRATRAPEASSDVMTDPEGMPAAWLEPSFNVYEIDVVHAIAVESPEDPQGVITGILEGMHHSTWHKNGISRANRQGLVANVSHSRAR